MADEDTKFIWRFVYIVILAGLCSAVGETQVAKWLWVVVVLIWCETVRRVAITSYKLHQEKKIHKSRQQANGESNAK